MRNAHDIGGLPAGKVDRTEREYEDWEKRIDAMLTLLSHKKKILLVDERRREVESLGAELYNRMSYYEKWLASATHLLIEKGVFTIDELGRKLAAIEKVRGPATRDTRWPEP